MQTSTSQRCGRATPTPGADGRPGGRGSQHATRDPHGRRMARMDQRGDGRRNDTRCPATSGCIRPAADCPRAGLAHRSGAGGPVLRPGWGAVVAYVARRRRGSSHRTAGDRTVTLQAAVIVVPLVAGVCGPLLAWMIARPAIGALVIGAWAPFSTRMIPAGVPPGVSSPPSLPASSRRRDLGRGVDDSIARGTMPANATSTARLLEIDAPEATLSGEGRCGQSMVK